MAVLSTGADAVGGERFGNCEYNDLKNHWRMAGPCTNLANIQPGMIVSDENDDRLYLATLVSGCPCSEILQECVPLSDDARHGYGNDEDASVGYDETTNDALIVGVPFDGKHGIIFCNQDVIDQDFTGILLTALQPRVSIVDADYDSSISFGFWGDDIPNIECGQHALNLQWTADQDIVMFANSVLNENRDVYIYGYISAGTAPRYARFRMDDTFDEFEIEAENNANHEGITVLIQEANQKFRVRGTGRALRFYVKSDGEIGTNQAVAAGHSGGYTPGVISHKIPIYDENQSYLGDLPIYETLS